MSKCKGKGKKKGKGKGARRMVGLLVAFLLMFGASSAWAAWGARYTIEVYGTHGIRVPVILTADGSASGALELRSIMAASDWAIVNGAFLMSVSVNPGTGSVAPDGAYDVNVYDSAGVQTIDATTTSEATKHTYPTNAGAVATSQQILGGIPFDVGDIGSSGDQTTLYFNIYIP